MTANRAIANGIRSYLGKEATDDIPRETDRPQNRQAPLGPMVLKRVSETVDALERRLSSHVVSQLEVVKEIWTALSVPHGQRETEMRSAAKDIASKACPAGGGEGRKRTDTWRSRSSSYRSRCGIKAREDLVNGQMAMRHDSGRLLSPERRILLLSAAWRTKEKQGTEGGAAWSW